MLARAAAIEPDPIFALIKAAKLARIKLEEGHAVLERLLNQFSSDVPLVGKVTILGHQFESNRRDKLVALLNEAKLVEREPAAQNVPQYCRSLTKRSALMTPSDKSLAWMR
jgi:hypothetical protein